MEIATIGFTKHSAERFFGSLSDAGVELLVDVRLNNTSHLAGFAKAGDLPYFLNRICGISYRHELSLAPTQELLEDYRKNDLGWDDYASRYLDLLEERHVATTLERSAFDVPTVLLCSEHGPEKCHRRLAAEYLNEKWGGVDIVHL